MIQIDGKQYPSEEVGRMMDQGGGECVIDGYQLYKDGKYVVAELDGQQVRYFEISIKPLTDMA